MGGGIFMKAWNFFGCNKAVSENL